MTRTTEDAARLAVLIDAENARAQHFEKLLVEMAKYGTTSVRRAYGDWTSTRLGSWKPVLLAHSVQPIQQFSYTTGKNATDSALIIDAMDLIHGGNMDGFCLVSSDSDFTRLAARIREDGLKAYGFGERKTPKPFVAACDTFVYVENLVASRPQGEPRSPAPYTRDATLDTLLAKAVDLATADDGWAPLSAVGSHLSKLASDFDARTWGYSKLSELVRAHPDYQLRTNGTEQGKPATVYVRRKLKPSSSPSRLVADNGSVPPSAGDDRSA